MGAVVAASSARAVTTEELLQQIQALQQQIQILQDQLKTNQSRSPVIKDGQGPPVATPSGACPAITRVLKKGHTGDDITQLQTYLAKDSSIYPEGLITGYYGSLTEKAVQRWQAKQGIISSGAPETTGYGLVGPRTRAEWNSAYGCEAKSSSELIKVLSPNGGEVWNVWAVQKITWASNFSKEDMVQLALVMSVGKGCFYIFPIAVTKNTGMFEFLLESNLVASPFLTEGTCEGSDYLEPSQSGFRGIDLATGHHDFRVRVSRWEELAISIKGFYPDQSDAPFSIVVATSTTSAPTLISPASGAVLDNGRTDRQDSIIWDFDWSDVPGATTYEIAITKNSGSIAYNDTKVVAQSSYHYVSESAVIAETNRYGWSWKVRALVSGNWSDWSEARSFEVEPVDTDQLGPPPHITILSPNGGEVWAIGSRQTIKWSSLNVPSEQILSIGARGFGSFTQMGEDGKPHIVSQKDFPLAEAANTGSINIETSNLQSGKYQVFIKTSVNSVIASDFSDAQFTIVSSSAQN